MVSVLPMAPRRFSHYLIAFVCMPDAKVPRLWDFALLKEVEGCN